MPSVTLLTLPGCYELRGRLLLLVCASSARPSGVLELGAAGGGGMHLQVLSP